MKKFFTITLLTILSTTCVLSQNYLNPSSYSTDEIVEPYDVNLAVDLPISIVGTGLTMFGFYKISGKDDSDSIKIANLSLEEEIIKINRWKMPQNSKNYNKVSDYFFYGILAAPTVLLFDKNISRDAAKIGLLYWETMAVTATMYTMSAAFVNKERPLAYDRDVKFTTRADANARNSFIGGHPAVMASSSFFMAKVVSDYYPNRVGLKRVMFTSATALTVTMGYLRFKAGKHFLTDIVIGSLAGALNGILIPHWHKKKNKDKNLSFNFFSGEAHGISATYKLK